jgi:diaminopropionate ammonia-lyase
MSWTSASRNGTVVAMTSPPDRSAAAPLAAAPGATTWYANPVARRWRCDPVPADVRCFHSRLPGYAPTPLVELPSLAAELGVGRVLVKDESARMGLGAFKMLGASWAVHWALARWPAGRTVRLVTATEGNHGRAVARLARIYGQPAEVFVPDGVRPAAMAAIAAEGARVTPVAGDYDEAVRRAARAVDEPADGTDAVLIQDTAWPGYEDVPRWIVQGYSTLFAELDEQLAAAGVGGAGGAGGAGAGGAGGVGGGGSGGGAGAPDLLAVPVGVGSLAQAAVTHYRGRPDDGGAVTALLSVEPDTATAALSSLTAGRPLTAPTGHTAMAGLNCGTLSTLAWPVLRDGLDAAVAVTESAAARAVRDLGALGLAAGPTGAATLAGARAALTGPDAPGTAEAAERRRALGVGPASTVVLLSTEGSALEALPERTA